MDLSSIITWDQQATLAINGSDSLFWDNIMFVVTHTLSWTLLLIALFIVLFKNKSVKDAVLMIVAMAVMIAVADRLCSGLVKPMVARWRPTQDPQLMYLVDVVDGYRGGRFGFFSGHACNTFCVAMFLSLAFRYGKLTAVMFFWCATTTFTRLYLGVHYLGDVLVGAVVGCLIGWLFYKLYTLVSKPREGGKLVSVQFTPTGFLRSDMNMFISVIFFNYICLVLFAMSLGVH